MSKRFVKVVCDVRCDWQDTPPRYRAFVDDELFVERTWIWNNCYLQEAFQIEAWPGKYTIHYKLVDAVVDFKVSNYRIEYGNATVNEQGELVILE